MSWSATPFATAIEALSERPDGRGSSIGTVTRSIVAVVVAWSVVFGGVFAFFHWVGIFGIWQLLGLWPAIGWALFAYISTTVSVISAVLALNATAWLILHMSSEEVVDYLRSLSE